MAWNLPDGCTPHDVDRNQSDGTAVRAPRRKTFRADPLEGFDLPDKTKARWIEIDGLPEPVCVWEAYGLVAVIQPPNMLDRRGLGPRFQLFYSLDPTTRLVATEWSWEFLAAFKKAKEAA